VGRFRIAPILFKRPFIIFLVDVDVLLVGLVGVLYVLYFCGGVGILFGYLSISNSCLRVYGLLELCLRCVFLGLGGGYVLKSLWTVHPL
jgi:hypothetical protein